EHSQSRKKQLASQPRLGPAFALKRFDTAKTQLRHHRINIFAAQSIVRSFSSFPPLHGNPPAGHMALPTDGQRHWRALLRRGLIQPSQWKAATVRYVAFAVDFVWVARR